MGNVAYSIAEGSQSRNSNRAGFWRTQLTQRAMEEPRLPTGSHPVYDHLSRVGATHSELGPPTTVINHENESKANLGGVGAFSPLRSPLPK